MIDLTVNEDVLASAVGRAKERHFKIPTFAEMRDPSLMPADVTGRSTSSSSSRTDHLTKFRRIRRFWRS